METMVRLVIERMNEELEKLKKPVRQQQEMKSSGMLPPVVYSGKVSQKEDEYLASRNVQKILVVCYNKLRKIVKQGVIRPIRVNQQSFRYSKAVMLLYLSHHLSYST